MAATNPYLPPVEHPRGLMLKLVYRVSKRQYGKVPTPIAVFCSRVPTAFLSFIGKISKLDKKLELPAPTVMAIRERVAGLNGCMFCLDVGRWFALKASKDNAARLDALHEYRTSPLFTDAERAALDYVTELTTEKKVAPATFEQLAANYSERQICEIVWLVASEHFYNMANHGLNIGSDGFCELRPQSTTDNVSELLAG